MPSTSRIYKCCVTHTLLKLAAIRTEWKINSHTSWDLTVIYRCFHQFKQNRYFSAKKIPFRYQILKKVSFRYQVSKKIPKSEPWFREQGSSKSVRYARQDAKREDKIIWKVNQMLRLIEAMRRNTIVRKGVLSKVVRRQTTKKNWHERQRFPCGVAGKHLVPFDVVSGY